MGFNVAGYYREHPDQMRCPLCGHIGCSFRAIEPLPTMAQQEHVIHGNIIAIQHDRFRCTSCLKLFKIAIGFPMPEERGVWS